MRVFIYNGEGASSICADDAKEFMTAYGVFGKPDVCFTNSLNNVDQLKPSCTAVVIPGGSLGEITRFLSKNPIIYPLILNGAHYLGFCAGAYLALKVRLFSLKHQFFIDNEHDAGVSKDVINAMFQQKCINPSLSSEYLAYGPYDLDKKYYANRITNGEEGLTQLVRENNYIPYETGLNFSGRGLFSALYVAGCGFVPSDARCTADMSVIARYPEQRYFFHLLNNDSKTVTEIRLTDFPAIIAQKPNPEKNRGGVFLSGAHVEASVENGKMYRFFSPRGGSVISLTDDKIEALEKSKKLLREAVVSAINQNFSARLSV